MSNLQKAMFGKAAGAGSHPSTAQHHQQRKKSKDIDISPLPWSDYFQSKETIKIPNHKDSSVTDEFNVYICGDNSADSDCPLILLLHGGGFSGLSWALFSKEIEKRCKNCQIVAPDLRGHGDTVIAPEGGDESDWSTETQCKDVAAIAKVILNKRKNTDANTEVPVVIVGHSMGGAIATHISKGNYIPSLVSLVVIDVVEGTALAALPVMKNILRARPRGFESVEDAIDWAVQTGHIR